MIYLKVMNDETVGERIRVGDVVQVKLNDRAGDGLYCVIIDNKIKFARRAPTMSASDIIGKVTSITFVP